MKVIFYGHIMGDVRGLHIPTNFSVAKPWLKLFIFAILVNKLHKITKIFEELDPHKSQGVLCQL